MGNLFQATMSLTAKNNISWQEEGNPFTLRDLPQSLSYLAA